MTHCFTQASSRLKGLIVEQLHRFCGHLRPSNIILKPNWVLHETDPAFPICALVTNPNIIEVTVDACLELFPQAKSILVADCPLQYADWPLMCAQSGLDHTIDKFSQIAPGKVVFRDMRKSVFKKDADNFLVECLEEHGDPKGYREVELGPGSHLEAISHQSNRFAVNDYSATVTRSNHRQGSHRYLIAQSFLDADLFINL